MGRDYLLRKNIIVRQLSIRRCGRVEFTEITLTYIVFC